ncbi:MAG: sec-independent protein translocase protein TatB [Motiliproteus sp.]|jgi:sec-independent protein translocase protein TatB
MFDIGFSEILIIGVVALVVLGPERLPMALRTGGLWLSKVKRTIGSVQKEISEELRIEEMRQKAKQQQVDLEAGVETLTKPFHESLRDEMLSPVSEPVASVAETSIDSVKSKADSKAPLVE